MKIIIITYLEEVYNKFKKFRKERYNTRQKYLKKRGAR